MISSIGSIIASLLLLLSSNLGAPSNSSQITAAAVQSVASASTTAPAQITTAAALQSAITAATPGTTIVIANGTYSDWTINVTTKGTSGSPIVIKPQTAGGVIFSGATRFNVYGSYVTIQGLSFNNDTAAAAIYVIGNNNRFTANQFTNQGSASYQAAVTLGQAASSNEIDSNSFTGGTAGSVSLQISDTGTNLPSNNTISQNVFSQMNVVTVVALGQGTAQSINLNNIVENNAFSYAKASSALISVRSSGNTVTGNTATASTGGVVVFSGTNNSVSGNSLGSATATGTTPVTAPKSTSTSTPSTNNASSTAPSTPTVPPAPVITKTVTTSWPLSQQYTSTLSNYSHSNVTVHGAGNDRIVDYGANDVLIGGNGDTTYETGQGSKIIEQPNGGTDTVISGSSFTLPANVENLMALPGTATPLSFQGNSLNNVITGGAGNDIINGWDGDDLLTGNGGSNIFVEVAGHEGDDTIADFNPSKDTISFGTDGATVTFQNFAQVQAATTQVGTTTVITTPAGDILTLRGVNKTSLTASNFTFPLNVGTGYAMSFDDEFNSFNRIIPGTSAGTWKASYEGNGADSSMFTSDHSLPQNTETEVYVEPEFSGTCKNPLGINPYSINNGVLSISANPTPAADLGCLNNIPYTSGTIDTKPSFSQTYGYFEMRAKLPEGKGSWPAFWLLAGNRSWPPESDIFESIGDQIAHETQHRSLSTGNKSSVTDPVQNYNMDGQFHTYGLLWTPTTLTYYVDGVPYLTMPTPSDMHTPMYIIAGLAIGGVGSWSGAPDASTIFPQHMDIDYIRAYSLPGMAGKVAQPFIVLNGSADGVSTTATHNPVVYAKAGDPVTLTWNVTNATACTVDASVGGWKGNKTMSGTETVTGLTKNSELTLLCWGPDASRFAPGTYNKNLNDQSDRKTISVRITK